MKYKLLLFAFMLCAFFTVSAQAPDSLAFYRHSLGITVNPIFNKEAFKSKHPTALGFIYRYHHRTNKSVRIGVSGAYERRTYLTTHIDSPAPQDSILSNKIAELAFGHEWNSQLDRLFTLGYGIDVTPYIQHQHVIVDNILIGENILINEKYKAEFHTTGISLQPFLNLKLVLSQRLYLVAECKASLSYSKEKYSAAGTRGDVNEHPEDRGILFGGAEREKINFNLNPLSSLQLNFRL